MTLDEARDHIGAGVVYHSGHGRPEDVESVCAPCHHKRERGRRNG